MYYNSNGEFYEDAASASGTLQYISNRQIGDSLSIFATMQQNDDHWYLWSAEEDKNFL